MYGWTITKTPLFVSGWINNMAARANSRFWLADFKKIFSETTGSNLTKLYWNDVWLVFHKNTSFCSGRINNMAARANSRFWLADFKKNLLLWNFWVELYQTLQEWCMGSPSQKYLFSFWLNKHGSQGQF